MGSLNLSLEVPCCRHDMWTYLVLYSVKWMYWIDPCRENEILVYMPTSLINEMFELVPWCRHDMWAYLILYSVKWKYWNDFVSKVFDFVFGKMKVLECVCRENEILVYLVSYSVKWKYWIVSCCKNEILAYMVTILINMKVELVPWFKTWYLNLFGFKFGKMKVLKWPLSRSLINGKFELVPWRPLMQTWYVNLFGFVFGKMNVLDWPLSRKWDFGLYAYKFDK